MKTLHKMFLLSCCWCVLFAGTTDSNGNDISQERLEEKKRYQERVEYSKSLTPAVDREGEKYTRAPEAVNTKVVKRKKGKRYTNTQSLDQQTGLTKSGELIKSVSGTPSNKLNKMISSDTPRKS